MNLRKQAIKGVIWSVIETWGLQVFSSAVFFLLARLLGPEAFGLVALASVFLALVQVFVDQGFSQALVQRKNLEPKHLDTAFWINCGSGLVLCLISIACSGLIASIFDEPALAPVIRWLSISFLFTALNSVQEALLQRNLDFKALTIRSFVSVIFGGVVGICMAIFGLGVWSLVGQQLTSALARTLTLWFVSDWRPSLSISKRHFNELLSFGLNTLGIKLLAFINRRSDDILIGYYLGPEQLGYYTVAYRFLLISIKLISGVIGKVALPTFSKIQDQPEKIKKAFYQVTQATSIVSFPFFIGASILASEIIYLMFGEAWVSSISVMRVLSFIGIVQAIGGINGNIIVAMGKPNWSFRLGIFNSAANLVCFLLVVQYGILAVATAFVIRGYLIYPIQIYLVKKLIRINYIKYISQISKPLAASIIAGICVYITRIYIGNHSDIRYSLLLYITIMFFSYLISIYAIYPKIMNDIFQLKKQLGK